MPGGPGYPGGLPQITSDATTLVFCARDRGCTGVYQVGLTGHPEPKPVHASGGQVVSGLSVAKDAPVAACVVADRTGYGEVVLIDLASGQATTLTDHTATSIPQVALVAPTDRTFTIGDGSTVHGFAARDRPGRQGRPRCCSTSTAARTTPGARCPIWDTATSRCWSRPGGPS